MGLLKGGLVSVNNTYIDISFCRQELLGRRSFQDEYVIFLTMVEEY